MADPLDLIARLCHEQPHDALSKIADTLGYTEGHDKAVRDEGFNAGTVAALAVVTAMDCGVTWREIVQAAGTQELLRHALTHEGDWEWAGFKRYAVAKLGQQEVTKARRAVAAAKRRTAGVPGCVGSCCDCGKGCATAGGLRPAGDQQEKQR